MLKTWNTTNLNISWWISCFVSFSLNCRRAKKDWGAQITPANCKFAPNHLLGVLWTFVWIFYNILPCSQCWENILRFVVLDDESKIPNLYFGWLFDDFLSVHKVTSIVLIITIYAFNIFNTHIHLISMSLSYSKDPETSCPNTRHCSQLQKNTSDIAISQHRSISVICNLENGVS